LLGLDVFDGVESWSNPTLPSLFDGGVFEERLYQLRFVNIGAEHIDELRASTRVTVALHSNVVELVTTAEGRAVDHVEVATLGGKHFRARARAFVIATGGIENARLLLASRTVHPEGIGNDHDLVGRFFMEHAVVSLHRLPTLFWSGVNLKRYRIRETVDSVVPPNSRKFARLLAPGAATIRKRGLLNVTVDLTTDFPVGTYPFTDFEQALLRAGRNIDGQCRGSAPLPDQEVGVAVVCEHAPNFDSRVRLTEDRDALGMRRVELAWRIGDLELDTMQAAVEMLAAEMANRGLGRMRLPLREEIRSWIIGVHHHMGTTRMHSDPKRGVVDTDCKVFGIDNLFVAGSSVFCTAGAANPTYTLLALALRLANHLRGWFS
jgi:choline dehydrogenase-like flavoprotein